MKPKFNRFFSASATVLIVFTTSAYAQRTWNGTTDASWSTPTNWTPNTVPTATDLVTYGAGTAPGTAITNPTQTLDGARSVLGFVLGNSNLVTLNAGTGGTLTIGASGILLNSSSGAGVIINAPVTLAANQSWVTGGGTNTRPITVNGSVNLGTHALTVRALNTNTVTLGGAISGTGSITKSDSGTLSFTGATTLTGTGDKLTINAGSVTVANGASLDLGSGGVLKSSATSAKGTLNINTGGTVTAASLTSAWGTNMALDGTLTTTGAFTFSGGTSTITGTGTAKVGSLGNTNFGTSNINGARFNIGSGGITSNTALNLGATTIGAHANWSSSSAMGITNAATGVTFNTLDSVDGTSARTIELTGALSGVGKLNKTGEGALVFSGASKTYSGATTVSAGTLFVNGALTNSAVTVDNTGTLSGSSTISQLITVAATGRIAPGNSIGTLTAGGNVDLNGTLEVEYGTVNIDMLAVLGELDLTGSTASFVQFAGVLDGTSSYTFASYGTLVGTFGTVTNVPAGYAVDYAFGGNNIALVLIPEPSTALLGALSCLALLRRRRN